MRFTVYSTAFSDLLFSLPSKLPTSAAQEVRAGPSPLASLRLEFSSLSGRPRATWHAHHYSVTAQSCEWTQLCPGGSGATWAAGPPLPAPALPAPGTGLLNSAAAHGSGSRTALLGAARCSAQPWRCIYTAQAPRRTGARSWRRQVSPCSYEVHPPVSSALFSRGSYLFIELGSHGLASNC